MAFDFLESKLQPNQGINENISETPLSAEQKNTQGEIFKLIAPQKLLDKLPDEYKNKISQIEDILTLYSSSLNFPTKLLAFKGELDKQPKITEKIAKIYIDQMISIGIKGLKTSNSFTTNPKLQQAISQFEEDPELKFQQNEESKEHIYKNSLKETEFLKKLLDKKVDKPFCLMASTYRNRLKSYNKLKSSGEYPDNIINDILGRGTKYKLGKVMKDIKWVRSSKRRLERKNVKKIGIEDLKGNLDAATDSLNTKDEKNPFIANYKNQLIDFIEQAHKDYIKKYTKNTDFSNKKASIDDLMAKL